MDPDRMERLVSGYLGDSLTEAEAAELCEAVEQPGDLRDALTRHVVVDLLVRESARPAVDADRVLRAVASSRSPGFADQVLSRIPAPRRRMRRQSGARRESSWLLPAALAAGFLLVVAILMTVSPAVPVSETPIVMEPRRPTPRVNPAPAATPVPAPPRPAGSTPRSASAIGREANPQPVPKSPAKPVPMPSPLVKPARTTKEVERVVLAATVASLEGRAHRLANGERVALESGQGIPVGHGVATDPGSRAVLLFDDGTRVVVVGTILDLKGAAGKSLRLTQGTVEAVVARQPAGRPMELRTPHAVVTVVGTAFTLAVAEASTRVEVGEGRVRVKRFPDGDSVEVRAGHVAVVGAGMPLKAERITRIARFQDGVAPAAEYAGTRDTSLSSKDPEANAGNLPALRLYHGADRQNAALLRWDVSSIPRGSRVLAVEVTFYITGAVEGAGFGVYPANQPWVESEATWRSPSAGRRWQVSGAKGGRDRGTRVLGTLRPPGMGPHTLLLDERGTALVQTWVNTPAANHGIIVASEDRNNEWDLDSREAAKPGRRPRLTVTYLPPAGR